MLQLNSKWRINADKYNWILEKRVANKDPKILDEFRWVGVSYHGKLSQAINKFCDVNLKRRFGKTDVDLASFLTAIEELKSTVNVACQGIDAEALKVAAINESKGISNEL